MRWSDAQLRADYQAATAARSPRAVPCPDEETLCRAVQNRLGQREREAVADHLVTCSECAGIVKLLASLEGWAHEAAAVPQGRPGPASVAAPKTSRRRFIGLAAVLVAAAAAGVLWRQKNPGESLMRGPGPSVLALEPTPANRTTLDSPPQVLSWSATVEPEDLFVVTVYDTEMSPMWRSEETPAQLVALPSTLRGHLTPGQRYYWRVVMLRHGARLPGPLLSFELASTR